MLTSTQRICKRGRHNKQRNKWRGEKGTDEQVESLIYFFLVIAQCGEEVDSEGLRDPDALSSFSQGKSIKQLILTLPMPMS